MTAHLKACSALFGAFLMLSGAAPFALAQARQPSDLVFASLEDLMKIEITSAGRKEAQVEDIPAAVFVVTQDDIRRSGVTALAEVLRRVPGVQIARQNSGNWALTVRGFNGSFANKLLVLIDGRSIYSRMSAGVFWSAEDLLLDDIERIEVVRGPGGAVWGANAVNGVINIITKSAADTTGTLVRVGDGSFEGQQAAIRYGRSTGQTAFRLSSQWSNHEPSQVEPGVRAADSWHIFSTAGRVDTTRGANTFLGEGHFSQSDSRPLGLTILGPTDFQPSVQQTWNWLRADVFGRWTHTSGAGATFKLQTFYDYSRNDHSPAIVQQFDTAHVADVDLEYHRRVGVRHDIVAGGGYRYLVDNFRPAFNFTIIPASTTGHVANVFAQDEISLTDRVRLTVGSRLEHDTLSGTGVEPTARILWDVGPAQQHLWASASRALRTASPAFSTMVLHLGASPGQDGVPVVFGVLGNPDYQTERFHDLEAGYRVALGARVTVDLTAFKGHYDALPTLEPAAPRFDTTTGTAFVFVPVEPANLMQADTRGAEVVVRWMPGARLSMDGSYSHFSLTARVDPSSRDALAAPAAEAVPHHQWQLHSTLALGKGSDLSASLFRVSELPGLAVAAYTRADARLEMKLTRQLSAVAAGQNLLHSTHAESVGNENGTVSTLVPRNAQLQLVWRFQ